jgi:hypothetical protein
MDKHRTDGAGIRSFAVIHEWEGAHTMGAFATSTVTGRSGGDGIGISATRSRSQAGDPTSPQFDVASIMRRRTNRCRTARIRFELDER